MYEIHVIKFDIIYRRLTKKTTVFDIRDQM